MLSLTHSFSIRRIACLAYRNSHRLYPKPEEKSRRLRFYLRSALSLRLSAIWFDTLDTSASLDTCARYEPEMAEKLHRPYRRSGISVKNRLELLLDHNRIIMHLGWSDLVAKAYQNTVEIASFTDRDGKVLQLVLDRPGQFGKEGELALHLVDGDTRRYSACFSFMKSDGIRELDVGCIQGPDLQDARQSVRDLTRGLHGLRPRSLILEALRSIADTAGCARLRVVGNANHIYRSLRKRRKIAFDYDAFCAEASGITANTGDWLLPVRTELRPLADIPSKKRAETNRRRALIEQINCRVQASIFSFVRRESGKAPETGEPIRYALQLHLTAATGHI
jgi:hypothetical protein